MPQLFSQWCSRSSGRSLSLPGSHADGLSSTPDVLWWAYLQQFLFLECRCYLLQLAHFLCLFPVHVAIFPPTSGPLCVLYSGSYCCKAWCKMSLVVLRPHHLSKRRGKNIYLGIKQVQLAKIIQQVPSEFWGLFHHHGLSGALHLLFSRNSPVSNTSSTPLILCIKSTELNHRTGLENSTQGLWNVWQWNKLCFNLTIYGWLLLSVQNIAVLQSKNNFDGSVYN